MVSLGLYFLALVPRLNAIWHGFITPDEPIWVYRSFRFLQALGARRWPDTFQIGHPGVVTMWMGALGIWWQRWRDPLNAAARLEWVDRVAWVTPDNTALFDRLAPFLPPARLAMAALTSLGVVGVYWLCRRLWDRRVALAGATLIALDPFIAGLSGLLHVDAPAMTFTLLSLLAWMNALETECRAPVLPVLSQLRSDTAGTLGMALFALFSGLCAGLGMLSKSPSIWIAAAVCLSALLYLALAASFSWRRVRRVALLGALWLAGLAGGLLTFPAMWGDPIGVIRAIYGLADRHLDVAHRVSFFRGVAGGAPGPWFYPTVLLYRLTPLTLAGLLFSLYPLFGSGPTLGEGASKTRHVRASLASLWVYALGFAAFITVGAKKFDRYLLPAFPALDLLAAMGWLSAVRWLYRRFARDREARHRDAAAYPLKDSGGRMGIRHEVSETGTGASLPHLLKRYAAAIQEISKRDRVPRVPRSAFLSILALFALLQGSMIWTGWPYYLAAYNPLVGGIGGALRTLPVGWGEGTEQMAAYLEPDQVIATGSPVTLAPLIDGQAILLDEASRRLADRVLIAATDRQIDPERVADLVSGGTLLHTVRVGGHNVLWLYDTTDRVEAEYLALYGAPGDLRLCDAPSPFSRGTLEGSEGALCLVVADASETELVERLNEWSAQHARLWYLAYKPQKGIPVASPIVAAALRRQLEAHAVRLDHVDLGYVTVTLYILPDGPRFALDEHAFPVARFGSQLAVTGGVLTERPVLSGGAVRLRLRWEALADPQADYAPFVHLLDAAGHMRKAGRGGELLVDGRHWPTSYWMSGDGIERDYALGLPDGLPPGRYWLAVGLADAQSEGWVPVVDDRGRVSGSTASLLSVDIQPPDEPPAAEALHLAHRTTVDWADRLRLLGYSYPARAYVGQRLVLETGWLGLGPIEEDYQVRLDLLRANGEPVTRQVLPLSGYPTSRWRTGEVIHELYDLSLPAELDGGEFELALTVLDGKGQPLILRDADPDGPSAGQSLGTLTVDAQERVFDLPRPPQHPLTLSLGPSISLLGYDLPRTAALPGQEIPLTLYWRGEGAVDASYTVFVHLLDEYGRVRGQRDRIPGQGRAPTSGWVEGQFVIDEYSVPLDEDAPPGTYRVEVGMYNADNMVRLPLIDANGVPLPDDRVLLDQEVHVE